MTITRDDLGPTSTTISSSDIDAVIEWSTATFGPGRRTDAVINHIRKELDEVRADLTDLSEWVDIFILSVDGMWREGVSPEAVVIQLLHPMESSGTSITAADLTTGFTKSQRFGKLTASQFADEVEAFLDGEVVGFSLTATSALWGAMAACYYELDVIKAIHAKWNKNRLRQWPDWRTIPEGQPIEHVKGIHD